MTLEQIVNALQVLRVACGTSSATYANGHFTTYNKDAK
jgi:hypothetical protein